MLGRSQVDRHQQSARNRPQVRSRQRVRPQRPSSLAHVDRLGHGASQSRWYVEMSSSSLLRNKHALTRCTLTLFSTRDSIKRHQDLECVYVSLPRRLGPPSDD